jgi:hypothetical protein
LQTLTKAPSSAQVQRPGLAGLSLAVVVPDGVVQGAAPDEAHGVDRRLAVVAADQFVDRHDTRMLQLPRNPGLVEEAGAGRGVSRPVRPQLLQRHVAAEVLVVGQSHLPDAPLGM